MRAHPLRSCGRAAPIALLTCAIAAPVQAQSASSDDPTTGGEFRAPSFLEAGDEPVGSQPAFGREPAGDGASDFFFGRPDLSVALRVGFLRPRARSEFHEFLEDRFTVGRSDFTGPVLAVEAGFWLSDHLALDLALEGSSATQSSEYRDWVEETSEGDLPIRQNTKLTTGPAFTGGLRVFPLSRGEALSRFAWVPRDVAPFVSGGGGVSAFSVEQWGDWVIEDTGDIVTEEYDGSGVGLVAYVGGGVEVKLPNTLSLVLDGRYVWGDAGMTDDFRDFDPIDLSGLRLTAGLAFTRSDL